MMNNSNRLVIDRYLTGLKTASFFYGLASSSALVLNLLFPFSENSDSVKAFQLTLFVAAAFHFGICFISNVGNYRILLLALISTVLIQGAVMNKINASDMAQFLVTSDQSVGGRAIDLMFWAPTMFLIVSILFFRLKIFLFFVVIYMIILAINLIPTLQTEGIYFSISKADIFFDNNAINRTTFMRSILTFGMVVGVGLAILWQANRHVQAAAEFEKNNAALGKYFSPDVKKEVEKAGLDVSALEPRSIPVAVLFTDIEGFTKLAEPMGSREVLSLLSEYQSLMVSAIFDHRGTVDKFIGDAVMATFGTPQSHGNDAQNAFDCAVSMHRKMQGWNEDRVRRRLPEIRHRVGIHYGNCVVGNVGSEQQLEYTVIGDTVNLASRICDLCKDIDTNFMVSWDLHDRITHSERSAPLNQQTIRGKRTRIDLVKIYLP
jgi:class 3 adenylate cyclase